MNVLGSALFRNVAALRRAHRTRQPMMESLLNFNMQIILGKILKGKQRCINITLHDPLQWNWFIDQSTTFTDRGALFNIQMCLYLKQILNADAILNDLYDMQFFQQGLIFLFILSHCAELKQREIIYIGKVTISMCNARHIK